MTEKQNAGFRYEIVEHIGVLNSYPTGWNKELNVVKWNDSQAKFDIRDWSPDHVRMTKGVTLHESEMKTLYDLCALRFVEETSEPVPEESLPETETVQQEA